MADYIDRDRLIKKFCNHCYFDVGEKNCAEDCFDVKIIKSLPTEYVAPVVHGKNLDRETPSIFTCSVCGWHSWDTYCGDTSEYNYCPNCGAKMRSENEGVDGEE